MTDGTIGVDRRTVSVLLVAGLAFALLFGLAMTGTVAAEAGSEASSCFARLH